MAGILGSSPSQNPYATTNFGLSSAWSPGFSNQPRTGNFAPSWYTKPSSVQGYPQGWGTIANMPVGMNSLPTQSQGSGNGSSSSMLGNFSPAGLPANQNASFNQNQWLQLPSQATQNANPMAYLQGGQTPAWGTGIANMPIQMQQQQDPLYGQLLQQAGPMLGTPQFSQGAAASMVPALQRMFGGF